MFGYSLKVLGATETVSISFTTVIHPAQNAPSSIALETWQLIGFTASIRTDLKFTEATVFSGTSSRRFFQPPYNPSEPPFDPSTLSFIRIGGATDSFGGDVSVVRIMTPGGGIIRYSQ